MPPSERDEMLIERILEDYAIFIKRLEYSGMNEDKFCNDHSFEGEYAYDALMNPLYRMVEDAGRLSAAITDAAPEIPWEQISGFRNFIAHGYAQLDRKLVWQVIVDDLPKLIEYFQSLDIAPDTTE